jgi:hypothetical protein
LLTEVKSHSQKDRFLIALHSPDGSRETGLPVSPPERRSAELAFWVQQDTFSESGLSAKHAELRGFSAIFRGKSQGFSAVETCWRRMQSRANPSPPLNSLLTGKNTGNFVNSIGSFRPLAAVNASICVTSAARAKSWLGIEQGIIRGLSGNSKPLIRELSFLSLMSPAPLVPSSPFGLRVADAPSPSFRTSYKMVSG